MLLYSDKEIIENAARIKQHRSSINGSDSVPRKKAKLYTETISLTKRYKNILDNTPEEHKELDKSGKDKKKIWVTGFVRLQPYGPNNELRKPIYIEPHSSYAWVNEGFSLTKIVE